MQPASYDDFCNCGHRLAMHVETDDNNEEREELATLTALLDELRGNGGDEQWRGEWYPVTLIRQTYFPDYAEELAEDIGAINREAVWPTNHIDWKAAVDELLIDYSEVKYDGVAYYYR